MTKLTLNDLASLTNETSAIGTINDNNDNVVAAIENTLSRNGAAPNQMEANLDMNSNRILNLPAPLDPTEPLRLGDIDPDSVLSQVAEAQAAAAAAAASEVAAATSESNATTSETNAAASAVSAAASATQLIGTSATSIAIGTGSKSFTTQASKFFAVGTHLLITSDANPTVDYMAGVSTAYSGTGLTVDVQKATGSGTHTDWTIRVAGAIGVAGVDGVDGADGADGATGATGATGLTGNSGLEYTWDTGTTDADPGVGKIRFNNATLSSVTFIYISKTGEGSQDYGSYIGSFDDSTNTSHRGTIMVSTVEEPVEYFIGTVSGALTDGTTYWKIPVTFVNGSGSSTAGEATSVRFYRTGDKGGDGVGIGDVVGPASSTDNSYVRYDGTTGKLLKNGTTTVPLADLDITGGTSETVLAATDELPIYDVSATANRKITLSNLLKIINALTSETAPTISDEVAIYDVSAGTADKITLEDVFKVIWGMTEVTSVDDTVDFLPIWDNSAGAARKVKPSNLGITTQPPTTQIFTSSGTWTRPTGCTSVVAVVIGGGGGGGTPTAAASNVGLGGSGGGGGGAIATVDVTALPTVAVTVGAGGAGGGSAGVAGSAGGASSFGTYAVAGGGGGGTELAAGTSQQRTLGGSGGSASTGDLKVGGQGAGLSIRLDGTSTGGWSSPAGSGAIFGGGGGRAAATNNDGTDGNFPGGGGSGAISANATVRIGGTGANGVVIVTEYYG